MKDFLDIGSKGEECPTGSVPIKRMTKEDLIREKHMFKVRNFVENNTPIPGTHYAIVRTKPGVKLFGAGSIISVWTPQVSREQYSAARLKISNGLDSIEAGWRVDPTLYGDNYSHHYIRIDAGQSHCFDSRCGFVVVDSSLAVGNVISSPTSKRGGPLLEKELFIIQNASTGDWFLELSDHKRIGFWPKGLFSRLAESGSSAEWGGEVFTPLGTSLPVMGAGSIHGSGDFYHDASFRRMSLFDGQKIVKADKLDSVADSGNYQVIDKGILSYTYFSHMMHYGGSASPSE